MKSIAISICMFSCLIATAKQDFVDSADYEALLRKFDAIETRLNDLEAEVVTLRAENKALVANQTAQATAAANKTTDTAATDTKADAAPATDKVPQNSPSTVTAPDSKSTTVSESKDATLTDNTATAATDANDVEINDTKAVATPDTSTSQARPALPIASAQLPKGPTSIAPVTLPPVYPGYIGVLDNKLQMKFSLSAQVDSITDSNFANSPGDFTTSSLPVQGQANYGSGLNSDLSFRQSQLSFHGIYQSPLGPVNGYYASNFFNSSGTNYGYNLQRLYCEWDGLRIGYDYTAFLDLSTMPSTLDYEGPNSLPAVHSIQVRYTRSILELEGVAFDGIVSLESANASNSGVAVGQNSYQEAPSGVLGLRVGGEDWHIQAVSVFSSLAAQTPTGNNATALGWGLGLSGSWQATDNDLFLVWGSGGSGYANYLQDAEGLGLDAYLTPAGELETISAWAVGAGYTRTWIPNLSSTMTYGFIHVDDAGLAVVGPTNMRRTWYGSGNLVWQATENLLFGAELLYGRKEAVNGQTGDDFRMQVSVRYQFNP